jgi:hypothetical protein
MDETGLLANPLRRIWLTLEGEEIVELKQLMMDRDVQGTAAFFQRVIAPQVRRAAEQLGIAVDVPSEISEET